MIGQDGLLAFDRLAVPWPVLPVRGHYHPFFAQRMPSFFPGHTLELDSRAKLYRARVKHVGGFAEIHIRSIRNYRARIQIDPIEQVIEFGAELEARAFLAIKPGDAEASSETEVDKFQSGASECVAPEIPSTGPAHASARRVASHALWQREIRRRQEPCEKTGSVGAFGVPKRRREGHVRPGPISVEVLTSNHPERVSVLEAADDAQLPVSERRIRKSASEEIFGHVIDEVD